MPVWWEESAKVNWRPRVSSSARYELAALARHTGFTMSELMAMLVLCGVEE